MWLQEKRKGTRVVYLWISMEIEDNKFIYFHLYISISGILNKRVTELIKKLFSSKKGI